MSLEQAIQELGTSFLYLGYVPGEPREPWCVMRPGGIDGATGEPEASQCVAHGRTWQEAYANAT